MLTAIKPTNERTYKREECITFRKTAEKFGGLSNMAGGYLLNVNGVKILTSEALYQSCRFPHLPEVQRQIIAERSPMTAKMKSKPHRSNSRPDWDIVRTKIMRWCLQVKLIQNWDKFSNLLLETGNLQIVEDSRKDDFWGAKPIDNETLIGTNVLGRLLMQLREQVKNEVITYKSIINPLSIADFSLYGMEINPISKDGEYYFECCEKSEESVINLKNNSIGFDEYDSLKIMLPHIINYLQEECTDKDLSKIFKTNLAQMREWLNRGLQLGQIKKLSKPVRYVAESQFPLTLSP